MELSISFDELVSYLKNQLDFFFPDKKTILKQDLDIIVDMALQKSEFNFSHTVLPQYWKKDNVYFNHLNSDENVVFLYFCSNLAYEKGNIELATKFFYLNKSLNNFHCMFDTMLPDIFLVMHGGSGVVLGKAKYSNFFVVLQGCTVGANGAYEHPEIDDWVIMYSASSVLGKSTIGHNSVIANNSVVLDTVIPSNSLCTGQYPKNMIKEKIKDRTVNYWRKDKKYE